MPTVNFSVPDDVEQAFNATFEGQNKSAVIAELMREAVSRAERRQHHRSAVDRMADRAVAPPTANFEQVLTRHDGAPGVCAIRVAPAAAIPTTTR